MVNIFQARFFVVTVILTGDQVFLLFCCSKKERTPDCRLHLFNLYNRTLFDFFGRYRKYISRVHNLYDCTSCTSVGGAVA